MKSEKEVKKEISFSYTLTETEKQAVEQASERKRGNKFAEASETEKQAIVKRILFNLAQNKIFNSGKEADFYLSIYSEGKKKFQRGNKFTVNGETVELLQAEQTGSNTFLKLTNGKVKLSGTSFRLKSGEVLKAGTFASLTAK